MGRVDEWGRIEGLLRRACSGTGGTIVLRGEPGIGKTALCAQAIERAPRMRVISTQGVESEARLAHGGLFDVLHPLRHHLDSLAQPQRRAVLVALCLDDGQLPNPLALGVATLGLLSAAASELPLLVVLDDAQWIDSASMHALAFAARRLRDEPVAFLVAVRDAVPDGGMDFHVEARPGDVIELDGLDAASVTSLLEQRRDAPVAEAVGSRLVELTAGNPLAVEEVGDRLSSDQLRGAAPMSEDVADELRVHGPFHARAAALPEGARWALLVCAASDSGHTHEVISALEALDLGRADLLAAEASALVSIDDGIVRFGHPLARTAVLHLAPSADRRAVHRALAESATAAAERAWHQAGAAETVDEAAAVALDRVAAEAEAAGAYVEAARAWERALALTPDHCDATERLLGAGRAKHLSGGGADALPLLDAALQQATSPVQRLAIQQQRSHILVWSGHPEELYRAFTDEGDRAIESDPFLASSAYLAATLGALQIGHLAEAEAAARAAWESGQRVGGLIERFTRCLHGFTRALRGDFEGESAMSELDGVADEALPLVEAFPTVLGLMSWAGRLLTVIEDHRAAEDTLAATVAVARDRGAIAALPAPLVNWAELAFDRGDWESAATRADEAHQVAEETGDPLHKVLALTTLGRLGALRGQRDAAVQHLTEAGELGRRHRAVAYVADTEAALGVLALGFADAAAAVGHLTRCAELADESGLQHPFFCRYAPDLVEAYLRAGDQDAAEATLAPFEWNASQANGNWGKAAAARCRGLVATDEWDSHFETALKHHALLSMPFEEARTELCYGERLRRSGRRVDARAHLRAALRTFDELGAEPWSARAQDELRSSGEHVDARATQGAASLTPQELRVALAVSRGHTNREVAAGLFVSPKTVENQLTRIYTKMGVRSRTELTRVISESSTGD